MGASGSKPSAGRSSAVHPDCVCTGSRLTTNSTTSSCHRRLASHALAPADDAIVVDAVEPQGVVALQRRVRAADRVHQADQVAQAVGPLEVPVPHLVLLGVEVLLAARLPARVRSCSSNAGP